MKTAEEMLKYCRENNYGRSMTKSGDRKHFSLIEQALEPDEDVLICFVGAHNFKSTTQHDGYFAYGLTKKRLIYAQYKSRGTSTFEVPAQELIHFQSSGGTMYQFLSFGTEAEVFDVEVPTDDQTIKRLCSELNSILESIRK